MHKLVEQRQMSVRRACKLIKLSGSVLRYEHRRGLDHATMDRLRALAARHPRWGMRKMHATLRMEGMLINRKRTRRLCRILGLHLRRKVKRRLPARVKEPMVLPIAPNITWSMDFMRHPGQWPQVPHLQHHRRPQPRSLGHHRGYLHQQPSGGTPTGPAHRMARQARAHPHGQRTGVHRPRAGAMGRRAMHRAALHPQGQAHGERADRALQPHLSRGGARCQPLRNARPGARRDQPLDMGVQQRATA
ncbi:MAG: transposase [Flavobacteriales bacterium]|nr:transposase [Flavobacteriales bacterium]